MRTSPRLPPSTSHSGSALSNLQKSSTGSSNRVARISIQAEPALLDTGELTDKGSVSAKTVLDRRRYVLDSLYARDADHGANIIDVDDPAFRKG